VGRGEVALVIGPNGAGKSTLVKAINGELPLLGGRVLFAGEDLSSATVDVRARKGIGYVPQLNDVFPTLSVQENLEMGGYLLKPAEVKARIAGILERFPQLVPLRRRAAKALSGGEHKLVAVARALVAEPALLILDEPTANLAPRIAESVLGDVVTSLKDMGRAVLLIEQRVDLALKVAGWAYVLVDGRNRHSGPAANLDAASLSDMFFGEARFAV
ncbi:MAG: ATP-binding cassette domain-containing protein, partial [Chloroflexota bacterium]